MDGAPLHILSTYVQRNMYEDDEPDIVGCFYDTNAGVVEVKVLVPRGGELPLSTLLDTPIGVIEALQEALERATSHP